MFCIVLQLLLPPLRNAVKVCYEGTACQASCCVLQSLLTARWPLELQHNKHSCVKQLQNVYLSPPYFGSIVGSFDARSEAPDDAEMLNLSQVRCSAWRHFSHTIMPTSIHATIYAFNRVSIHRLSTCRCIHPSVSSIHQSFHLPISGLLLQHVLPTETVTHKQKTASHIHTTNNCSTQFLTGTQARMWPVLHHKLHTVLHMRFGPANQLSRNSYV